MAKMKPGASNEKLKEALQHIGKQTSFCLGILYRMSESNPVDDVQKINRHLKRIITNF